MTINEKQQHSDFKAAKEIALSIENGLMRRARNNGIVTNYCGAKLQNRMFVIGDTLQDIQNPDCYINNKPAREIFGEFTVMSR